MRRNLVQLFLVAALLAPLHPVQAQLPVIPISLHHTVHGILGIVSAGYITVIEADNTLLQITVPAGYTLPPNLSAGKNVSVTFRSNATGNGWVLVRIHQRGSSGPSGSSSPTNVVNSVPHF